MQALKSHLEEVDPHHQLPTEDIALMSSAQLRDLMLQELPSQIISTEEWQEQMESCETPLEAAYVAASWIWHRMQTLEKLDDLQERRLAESPGGILDERSNTSHE